MATRSIISVVATEGYKTETGSSINIKDERIGWFGRYCHWDGYPEHMTVVIYELVSRFGIAGAKTRLMASSWSTLGTDGQGGALEFSKLNDNDPIGTVSYPTDGFLLEGGDDWGTEYRYLIKDDGNLDVYEVSYDRTTPHKLLNTFNMETREKIQAPDVAPLSILRIVQ
jgi:hypothetical protein